MALIPVVGRNTPKVRLLIAALYLALSLGAVTMVYPFLIMLGASVTSQYEQGKYQIVPGYLHSSRDLFGKYAEDKYQGDIARINAAYGTSFATLQDVRPPASLSPARLQVWNAFAAALPMRDKSAGFGGAAAAYSPSPLLDRYQAWLSQKFRGDILQLDRAYNQEDEDFQTIFPPFEQPAKHNWTPDESQKSRDWAEFQQTLPANYFVVVGADPIYQKWLKEEAYPSLDALNKAWGTSHKSVAEIVLPARPEGNSAERKDWETFVRAKLPFRDIAVAPSALPVWQAFLAKRYKGSVADFNGKHRAQAASFGQIALPDPNSLPAAGPPLLDWIDFLKADAPAAALSADTPETRWRAFAPNAGRDPMPVQAADWAFVQAHPGSLRQDFVTRNYSLVIRYILLHGRGVFVTFMFCLLSILTALIVNPLCAYALSRYNLSYGQAVLLFLLTTMAFPAEVAMIPNFLLLKQLGFLNTFWALILPGAASGYSIFLMKGFFDSLPKELYEAGTLDGASEMRMFWTITLPLSRPIFAVIALQAFTGAYGAFLFAMLVCQNSKMWTLMVWLYELQSNNAPEYVMMAALTLTAIPTLIVFVFAQNTIMKGIILPSFK